MGVLRIQSRKGMYWLDSGSINKGEVIAVDSRVEILWEGGGRVSTSESISYGFGLLHDFSPYCLYLNIV